MATQPSPDSLAALDAEIGGLSANPGTAAYGAQSYTAGTFVTPESQSWQVYLGKGSPILEPGQVDSAEGGRFVRDTHRRGDEILGTDEANARWYQWTDAQRKEWVDLLVKRGLVKADDPDLYAKAASTWTDAVQEAGNFYTLGGKKVTPWQVVDLYADGGGKNAGDPTTRTSTSTSVQSFDDLDARAAAEETYAAELGRSAKGKEAHALKRALNAYAEAHPQVTTNKSVTDADGNTTSDSHTSGGISAAGAHQIAVDQARANPNHAEYQAATTGMNWLLAALGPTVEGV